MGGGGSSGPTVIPFNMSELAPFMPSVFNGPYDAQGAYQNAQMLQQKYPWITPPAGEFAGAQPGQYAGANNAGGQAGFFGSGVPAAPPPNPPIPPSLPGAGGGASGSYNPQAMSTNQVNGMQPTSLQQILAILGSGTPTGSPTGTG